MEDLCSLIAPASSSISHPFRTPFLDFPLALLFLGTVLVLEEGTLPLDRLPTSGSHSPCFCAGAPTCHGHKVSHHPQQIPGFAKGLSTGEPENWQHDSFRLWGHTDGCKEYPLTTGPGAGHGWPWFHSEAFWRELGRPLRKSWTRWRQGIIRSSNRPAAWPCVAAFG